MHILLTGATGYIGKRLLPVLVANGYTVTCCVRDKSRFSYSQAIAQNINVVEVDFLKPETLANIPTDIDIAFYLIHSMASPGDYSEKEMASATVGMGLLPGTYFPAPYSFPGTALPVL